MCKKVATWRGTAFKGGRNMIGHSLFCKIVRTLTGSKGKLMHAVDYIKGTLVHDIVHMIQCIIDDHLKMDTKAHDSLSKKLELLSNFLKNLYKAHVKDDKECIEWATHGIHHGLSVPQSVSRTKHYSEMNVNELNTLLNARCILQPKSKSLKSCVEVLMDNDLWIERAGGDSDSSIATGSEGEDYDKGDDVMKFNQDSKESNPWCDGCAFLHYFILEELPNALCTVKSTEKNGKSLNSALLYLKMHMRSSCCTKLT